MNIKTGAKQTQNRLLWE